MYLLLQMDFRNSQFHFLKRSFCQILTPLPLFAKVFLAIQEISTSCHIIHTIIFHFTDGESISVNFHLSLLYHMVYQSVLENLCLNSIALQNHCGINPFKRQEQNQRKIWTIAVFRCQRISPFRTMLCSLL